MRRVCKRQQHSRSKGTAFLWSSPCFPTVFTQALWQVLECGRSYSIQRPSSCLAEARFPMTRCPPNLLNALASSDYPLSLAFGVEGLKQRFTWGSTPPVLLRKWMEHIRYSSRETKA